MYYDAVMINSTTVQDADLKEFHWVSVNSCICSYCYSSELSVPESSTAYRPESRSPLQPQMLLSAGKNKEKRGKTRKTHLQGRTKRFYFQQRWEEGAFIQDVHPSLHCKI